MPKIPPKNVKQKIVNENGTPSLAPFNEINLQKKLQIPQKKAFTEQLGLKTNSTYSKKLNPKQTN
jgi:hypothetical protein